MEFFKRMSDIKENAVTSSVRSVSDLVTSHSLLKDSVDENKALFFCAASNQVDNKTLNSLLDCSCV